MFHRVHATPDPLFPEEVDAARFERMMRLVAGTFRVMTLGDAASRLRIGELPARTMVITFDDGYADNAEVALPILKRYGLPATFFVSTGFLDGGRMWNDSVIECLRASRCSEVDLDAFGLGRVALSGPAERRSAIDSLLPRLKYLSLAGREEAIERLCRICDVKGLPSDLMMRADQVVQLHRAGMEIGGHTVHHPILTSLSPAEAEREIAAGRARLQEIIDGPVDVFAYPNGKPGQDYQSCHVDIVRRLGFKAAVSTAPGVGRAGDDLFQLPRFTPWDRSLPKWAMRLLLNQRNTNFNRVAATPLV
jgi:peptidoglycan/xylan/chitin deacetylase (PgdA/CDA1 family)